MSLGQKIKKSVAKRVVSTIDKQRESKAEKEELKRIEMASFREEKAKVDAATRKTKLEAAAAKGKAKAHKKSGGPSVSPATKAKAKNAVKAVGKKLKTAAERQAQAESKGKGKKKPGMSMEEYNKRLEKLF